jgi:hypothetical protein
MNGVAGAAFGFILLPPSFLVSVPRLLSCRRFHRFRPQGLQPQMVFLDR